MSLLNSASSLSLPLLGHGHIAIGAFCQQAFPKHPSGSQEGFPTARISSQCELTVLACLILKLFLQLIQEGKAQVNKNSFLSWLKLCFCYCFFWSICVIFSITGDLINYIKFQDGFIGWTNHHAVVSISEVPYSGIVTLHTLLTLEPSANHITKGSKSLVVEDIHFVSIHLILVFHIWRKQ